MEQAADAAGFNVFSEAAPTRRFELALEDWEALRGQLAAEPWSDTVKACLPAASCAAVLDFGAVGLEDLGDVTNLELHAPGEIKRNGYDLVIVAGLLSHMPSEDVPWLLDKAFSSSRGDVFVLAACDGEATRNGDAGAQDKDWWRGQMQAAGQRHGEVRWTLSLAKAGTPLNSARLYRG